MENRVCRKCLLWEDMPENMTDYLENHMNAIPENARTAPALLDERLRVCDSCNMLLEGICRACGCYVYLRASVKNQHCPYQKWQEQKA